MIIIDTDTLRRVLDYDTETGLFRWRETSKFSERKPGDIAGHTCATWGYVLIGIARRSYRAHRLAWQYVHGAPPTDEIDHIDGDRTHNAIRNLREATKSLNQQNLKRARSNNLSGMLGVSNNGRRFNARIKVDGKVLRSAQFDTPEEAHAAYLDMKRQHHEGCTL